MWACPVTRIFSLPARIAALSCSATNVRTAPGQGRLGQRRCWTVVSNTSVTRGAHQRRVAAVPKPPRGGRQPRGFAARPRTASMGAQAAGKHSFHAAVSLLLIPPAAAASCLRTWLSRFGCRFVEAPLRCHDARLVFPPMLRCSVSSLVSLNRQISPSCFRMCGDERVRSVRVSSGSSTVATAGDAAAQSSKNFAQRAKNFPAAHGAVQPESSAASAISEAFKQPAAQQLNEPAAQLGAQPAALRRALRGARH